MERVRGKAHDVGINAFTKPDDPGTNQAAAMRALRGNFGEGDCFIPPTVRRGAASIPAQYLPNGAVEADDILCAGPLVESVDILGDKREARVSLAPRRQYFVRSIGLLRREHLPPPVVPLPDETRVSLKRFRRGERFRPEVLPESVGSAKCRNAAGRGDTGPRHHRDARFGTQ